jgi:microcystin-dependent protein
MSEPFLGQISIFSSNFAPKGWAMCNGQTMPINQNQALFSLLGTMYGGNGQTTFALPNLQGRAAMDFGQGQGLQIRVLGEVGGEQNHTLIVGEMPRHSHDAHFATAADSLTPGGKYWAADPNGNVTFSAAGSEAMSPNAIGQNSGGQPHQNMQPYLVLTFCIALQGIFPSRT